MGFIDEYLEQNLSASDLFNELKSLVGKYNEITNRNLFLYVSAIDKDIPDTQIVQNDVYIFRDMLKDVKDHHAIDVYLETPGGDASASEDIASFLHGEFNKVNFVVSGIAKSAGTILALSGNQLYMTETGSLGPIDAQIISGSKVVSAYDYLEWMKKKIKDADENGTLNYVDEVIISQINPGDIQDVNYSYEYAKLLVTRWLMQYKFEDWNYTETHRTQVTEKMKEDRAKKIADDLANHAKWKIHGRSIRISDLERIGIKTGSFTSCPALEEVVYRIQIVYKLLFSQSSAYKIFMNDSCSFIKKVGNSQNKTHGEAL